MSEHQIAVIGAGPAGVSVALSLRDHGLRPLLIDGADDIGSSWRGRYDRLKLNTGRPFSHLPNRPYPKGTPMFPSRDEVVAHLDRHAHEDGIELRLGTTVNRIDRESGGWRLRTSTGDIDAPQVVVATGNQHTPAVPTWPGMDGFTGELLHSCQYRNPRPYQGKKALVVGCGSSGMEIAHDLATGETAKTWMAVRTPPNIMLRSLPGGLSADVIALPLYHIPIRIADAIGRASRRANLGDLSEFGLPIPEEGVYAGVARLDKVPALVDMDVIDAVRDGSIEVVATVESFAATRSHWWTDPGWTRTSSSVQPATGAIWNPWSATSACSTLRASRSSRAKSPPPRGCASSASCPGRPSSVTSPNSPSAWRNG